MTLWTVTLFNQHARRAYSATGRTRHAAFDRAFREVHPDFRHEGLISDTCSPTGQDIMWLAAFNDALAFMPRGRTMASHMSPRGFGVEIRRNV